MNRFVILAKISVNSYRSGDHANFDRVCGLPKDNSLTDLDRFVWIALAIFQLDTKASRYGIS
jgi:hypothetical protein